MFSSSHILQSESVDLDDEPFSLQSPERLLESPTIMLNARKLSELLAKNVDPKLYPRMFIMSPNGTLLAYSTPANIKELRDQAALISMAWKDHEKAIVSSHDEDASRTDGSSKATQNKLLETLTIEFDSNNLIIRAIQPMLLLVLVGGVPPTRKGVFKMTAEATGDPRYPSFEPSDGDSSAGAIERMDLSPRQDSAQGTDSPSPSSRELRAEAASHMSLRDKDIKLGALHIQRKKLDAMTRFIRDDFNSKGFVMPDGLSFP